VGEDLQGAYLEPLAGGKPRSLVVMCHGLHAGGSQLSRVAEFWRGALPMAGFAIPEAPWHRRRHWLGPVLAKRREWFSVHDTSPAAYEAGVRVAAGLLDRFIDAALARLGLAPDAYALAGYSQGAMTVLFAGLRRSHAPQAIVGIAGSLIAPDTLTAEIRNRAPVMLLHGTDDPVVPASSSQLAADILASNGVPVRTLFQKGLLHEINDIEIRESSLFLKRTLDNYNPKGIIP
jgi:phospholipase/carboxylesterase